MCSRLNEDEREKYQNKMDGREMVICDMLLVFVCACLIWWTCCVLLKQLASHTVAFAAAVMRRTVCAVHCWYSMCSFCERVPHMSVTIRKQQNEACYMFHCSLFVHPLHRTSAENQLAQVMPIQHSYRTFSSALL